MSGRRELLVKVLFVFFLCTIFCASCTSSSLPSDVESLPGLGYKFQRWIASSFSPDDGWCYSFIRFDMKKGYETDVRLTHYEFRGVNLRYAYSPDYFISTYREKGEQRFVEKYATGILLWGYGAAEQQDDVRIINEQILLQDRSVEELLALDSEQFEFKTLDKELFFRLMREALTGEPHKETTKKLYAEKPSYSMQAEPEYIDGYKFQIAYILCMGIIDEIYIDVRYQTGSEYSDYVQLSDLVDSGKADEEQINAFSFLQSLTNSIRGTDNLLSRSNEYKDLVIGKLDFLRLYTFLNAIETNEDEIYQRKPVTISLEEISN